MVFFLSVPFSGIVIINLIVPGQVLKEESLTF